MCELLPSPACLLPRLLARVQSSSITSSRVLLLSPCAILPDCTLADPEIDDGVIEDEDGFLSLASPEFQFNDGETIADYSNQIAPTIAEGTKFHLGIHDWKDGFHPKTLVHINLQVSRLLALADEEKDIEVKCDPQ